MLFLRSSTVNRAENVDMSMSSNPPVFRFAPSPNGRLHLGHAYSALINDQMAQQQGGRLLIRIEDIDQTRCTPDLEAAMLEDLKWLGLAWEEPIRRQSEHLEDYAAALDKLSAKGLTYRSHLSRSEIRHIVEAHEKQGGSWPRDPDGAPLSPGKRYETGEFPPDRNYSVRLDMDAALAIVGEAVEWQEHGPDNKVVNQKSSPRKWGDVVLARRDAPTSYHLAVTVDDALQGVTHVVRGRDLFEATAVHVLLQELLALPTPIYWHHDLILDVDGRKLSKSKGDTSLAFQRREGATPGDIRKMVGL